MKTIFILLSFFVFTNFTFAQIDVIPDDSDLSVDQWTMVTKKTATWCPFCGSWGWDFYHDLIDAQKDNNTLIWAAHFSGDLQTETAKAIVNNMGPTSGQPIFFLNRDNLGVNSGNAGAKLEEFNQTIELLNSYPALAAVGAKAYFEEGAANCTMGAKVKFLGDLEGGEYRLATYLMLTEHVAPQAGQGNDAMHTNLLRHALTDEIFGELISQGAPISNGQTFTITNTKDLSDDPLMVNVDPSLYKVVTILWSKVDDNFFPFNINVQDLEIINSSEDIELSTELKAYFTAGTVHLTISTQEVLQNMELSISNTSGKSIFRTHLGDIPAGETQKGIEIPNVPSGMYFVTIKGKSGTKSTSVLVP